IPGQHPDAMITRHLRRFLFMRIRRSLGCWRERALMKKSACDACGGRNLRVIYSRTRMPAFQNLLFGTEEEARKTPTAAVDLAACGDCGLVFNSLFEANLMEYDADYQNAQDHSPSFRAYLEEIADLVIALAGEKARYAEIG